MAAEGFAAVRMAAEWEDVEEMTSVAAAMDVVQRVMGVMVAADWDLGEKAEEKVLRMVADQAGAADSAAQRSSRSSV